MSILVTGGAGFIGPNFVNDWLGQDSEPVINEEAVVRSSNFVQDNHSGSVNGVLRGLHYQRPPRAQVKLVRVVKGKVLDVAVDIRKSSPTFGKWVGEILSAENKKQLWIPEGFAHGFLTLSDSAEFLYKVTDYYAPELERCIKWDDPTLNIAWVTDEKPVVSLKDSIGELFGQAEVFQ